MFVGRWLLALTLDAEFSIEHVYGHHRRLATPADPATARRGESFYTFLVRSVVGQTRSAFELERGRLQKLGHGTWSAHNRYLRGWVMSAALVVAFGACRRPGRCRDLPADGDRGPVRARGRQLLRALRPGARSGRAGRAASLLELEQAAQQRGLLQPRAPFAPSRRGRREVLAAALIPRSADAAFRLPDLHAARVRAAGLVPQPHDSAAARLGPAAMRTRPSAGSPPQANRASGLRDLQLATQGG